MTLLEERPEVDAAAQAPSPPAQAASADHWFDTSDHKRLGLLFVYASLLFLAASGVVALIAGGKQADLTTGLSAGRFAHLYGLHTQSSILLFLTAIWIGLATYVVPLQVGSGRLALPRLMATGFWTYLFGGACFLVSYIVGDVAGTGITQPMPIPPVPGGAGTATTLWVVSLGLIAVGFLLASASLLVTVAGLRTDGMTMLRVPAFSWATLVASTVTLVATPVFLGGLLLLGLDQHFGGHLFLPATPGSNAVWQHTVWLYGRPDVFLLTLIAVGAASDIVSTHARRPLVNHQAALAMLGLLGALSLGTWASATNVLHAVVVPTYNVVTALVVIPLGLTVLLWLGTMGLGQPRFHISLMFVVGAVGLWVTGAANAIAAAGQHVAGFSGNSAWSAGNVHMVVAGPPTLLAVGAVYHWAPKFWGRALNASMGALVFLCLFGGLLASGLAYYLLGYNGARLGQIDGISHYQRSLYVVAEMGGVLIIVGVLILVGDMVVNAFGGRGEPAGSDPYDGLTLEWATSSPPPRWGFDAVPEVRSEAPLYYLRRTESVGPGGGGGGSSGRGGAGAITSGRGPVESGEP